MGLIGLLLGLSFQQATAKDTVTLGLQLEPPSLDPTISADSAIGEVVYANLFEALTRTDPDGSVRPWLAAYWDISADGLRYVFHLHKNVRFQNGAALTAEVVKFSIERALAPGSTNPQKQALGAVKSVDIINPSTVQIVLSRPDSNLLFVLSWPALVIVEPTSAAGDGQHPVGTGPFRYGGWRRGEEITLVRNPAYWRTPPKLARAVFKFIADSTSAFAAIKSGDVDVFPDFPAPENIAQFKKDPRFAVSIGTTEGEVILAINNRKAPFNNILVRRAVSYALDRKAVINGAFYGYGAPIGSHFPPQDAGYVDLTGRYPHDIAKAKQLLAQAGLPNGFNATLKLPPPMYARRSGEIVAAQLAAVGIKLRIENIEWAQWLSQVFKDRNFDLTIINHVEPMDYDIYGRDDYYFGYSSQAFKMLLSQLCDTTDDAKRIAILQAIQRKIADDAVNGFLFELPKLVVRDARLHGFSESATVLSNDVSGAYFSDAASDGAVSVAPSNRAPVNFGLLLLAGVLLFGAFAVRRVGLIYFSARLFYLALTLVVASLVIFFTIQVLPGDPASFMMGLDASPEAIASLRHQLGLDTPLLGRYLAWVSGLLRGDFGVSYTYHVPVGTLVAEHLAVSLPLTLYALLITVILALPLGLLAATHKNGIVGSAISGFAQIGVAIPDFWLGILLVLLFSMTLRWFSAGGFPGWDTGVWVCIRALTLPAIALALPQAAILTRILSAALAEAMEADYFRTARAKGMTRAQALRLHALPNAIIPVLTILGLQFSFLLAGAIIIENVFFLPGLGRLLSQAIVQRDLIVVQSAVVLLVLIVVTASFVVDIAYALADPRLRDGRSR